MKTVHLRDSIVSEIIPEYAKPVKKWYGEEFASECIEAPDEVYQNWVYNAETNKWSEPENNPGSSTKQTDEEKITALKQENKLLKAQLQAQTERSDFIEDCIAEMAVQVYGGV